jgi:hypothetical protein
MCPVNVNMLRINEWKNKQKMYCVSADVRRQQAVRNESKKKVSSYPLLGKFDTLVIRLHGVIVQLHG